MHYEIFRVFPFFRIGEIGRSCWFQRTAFWGSQVPFWANSLSQLKGAAMKAGQLLSLDINDYFPPEAIEILSSLQNAAVAQPLPQIEAVLQRELGSEKRAQIKSLSPVPIGVASIGQVHRARFQGREIVLKVQYSGVSDSIDSDLKILKTIAMTLSKVTSRQMQLEPLFQEFRTILKQEVDYICEANFQKEYGLMVKRMGTTSDFKFHVPEVVGEISTGLVLAMSYEPGPTLRSWVASKPSMAQRESLAYAILDLYFHEFFAWGLVQTDPNWSNFLVQETGTQPRLVLLDFGATRRYSKDFIRDYVHLLQLAAARDPIGLKNHAIQFGLIDGRESPAAFLAFEQMLKIAIEPFFTSTSGHAKFDFSDKNYSVQSQTAVRNLATELIYSPPPYNLVFLHRKLGGIYSLLKNLKVRLDVTGYWQKMLEYSASQTHN